MATVTLAVPDISCERCERTITQASQGRAGVQQVQVNIPDGHECCSCSVR
jgi:copper chaperone CopZ